MRLNEVVATYIKLRDKKGELKADYDSKVLKIDVVLDQIEGKLLKAYQESGMESVKTSEGTAYISSRTNATVADRIVFMEHVMSSPDNIALLDVRCNKTAVNQYMEEHQDAQGNKELPPGVNWSSTKTINIKRA